MSVIVKLIHQKDTSNLNLKRLLDYIKKPDAQQEAALDVWFYNAFDEQSAIAELLALNEVNLRAKNSFKHLLVSYSPEVFPTREQAMHAGQLMLEEMGLGKCLAMVGMHYDKQHVHLHIAVVTINPDTFRSVHAQWAVNAMHRAAAKINFIQGWKSQRKQLYSILDVDGQAVPKRNSRKVGKLRASEVRAFHNQKPAGEVAATVSKVVLADSKVNSWEKFHQALASHGIEYAKKGSGSVFIVNQDDRPVVVKVSNVNRKAAMKLLQEKFGAFIHNGFPISSRQIEPVIVKDELVNDHWQSYNQIRTDFKSAKLDLKEKHNANYKNLLNLQSQERALLNKQGWKGMGTKLNEARMMMAGKHAMQKAKLKSQQLSEKSGLIKSFAIEYRNGTLNRFDHYLEVKDPDLFLAYKRQQKIERNQPYQGYLVGKEPYQNFSLLDGIENYNYQERVVNTKSGSINILEYFNQNNRIDFVDRGNRIYLTNMERASVRAFLQLAAQKWKSFELFGSFEFKYMCAEEAKKLNVTNKISNPEVQDMVSFIFKKASRIGAGIPHLEQIKNKFSISTSSKKSKLMKINDKYFQKPTTRVQLAINAYLIFAADLGDIPTNDFYRDLQIAIRLDAIGFEIDEIKYAIEQASPLVIAEKVHARYSSHIINLLNDIAIKNEYFADVQNNKQRWMFLTKQSSASSSFLKPD